MTEDVFRLDSALMAIWKGMPGFTRETCTWRGVARAGREGRGGGEGEAASGRPGRAGLWPWPLPDVAPHWRGRKQRGTHLHVVIAQVDSDEAIANGRRCGKQQGCD